MDAIEQAREELAEAERAALEIEGTRVKDTVKNYHALGIAQKNELILKNVADRVQAREQVEAARLKMFKVENDAAKATRLARLQAEKKEREASQEASRAADEEKQRAAFVRQVTTAGGTEQDAMELWIDYRRRQLLAAVQADNGGNRLVDELRRTVHSNYSTGL